MEKADYFKVYGYVIPTNKKPETPPGATMT